VVYTLYANPYTRTCQLESRDSIKYLTKSYTQLPGKVILACQFALIEGPMEVDSMGGTLEANRGS